MVDLSYAEIASILERTPEYVRSLQSRGVRFLRARVLAVGRESGSRRRALARGCMKHAVVLRARRFALR